MEAPFAIAPKITEKNLQYKKTTSENENYTLTIKIKDENTFYISIIFEKDNKVYEENKLLNDIKKEQTYFEDYTLLEIFDEISELISKDSFELKKKEDQIQYNIILPSKKRKTLDFVLEIQNQNLNINNSLIQKLLNQKDEIIKQKDEIIKEKDKIIKEKNDIILNLKEIIYKLNGNKNIENNNNDKKENKKTKNDEKQIELNYNEIFKDFNIINLTPKYKLSNHGENPIYTILQLQDGRLASGGNDGVINIYNKETFKPELTINEHSNSVYHIIQLKNGNLISCSNGEKTMNVYQLLENNNYKLLSQINVGKINQNYSPRKIRELENGQIGLVAQESIIFYLNINNQLDEDFKINKDDNQIGNYYNMIPVKPGELVICGNKDKIQFFELNSRKLKEIININRDIHWSPDNLLCMMNERCLCIGGKNKITLIDIYQKSIIKEIEDQGVHMCLFKLNDNILLSGKENDITQWKISQNNLTLVSKKEKAHQGYIFQIIKFNNLVISCSDDKSIKIW